MTPVDRQLLDTLAGRVRRRYPDARVWAFGSRVRGTATWESDLDVCVVLDRSVSREMKDWISDAAWEIGFPSDLLITTIVFDAENFDRGPLAVSPIVGSILQEGVAA